MLATTLLRKWPESLAQLSSKPAQQVSQARDLSIAKPAAVAKDEVALVAEEVDRAEDETGTPAQSTESTQEVTRTEASREVNGKPC
jgi:hypothetical protein